MITEAVLMLMHYTFSCKNKKYVFPKLHLIWNFEVAYAAVQIFNTTEAPEALGGSGHCYVDCYVHVFVQPCFHGLPLHNLI